MNAAKQWRVSVPSESKIVDADKALEVAGEMFAKHGVQPKVEAVVEDGPANDSEPPRAKALKPSDSQMMATSIVTPAEAKAEPIYSEFGHGGQIVDAAAKSRIEAQHAALSAGGAQVDSSRQLYATGTRMARVGYANQAQRATEHEKKLQFTEAAASLAQRVKGESREDVEVSAGEFGDNLHANGKITAFGLRVTEQAMRGMCARVQSPAMSYLFGLRERISQAKSEMSSIAMLPDEEKVAEVLEREKFLFEAMRADRAKIADVLRHECKRNPDVRLKLRSRRSVGDIFAVVSPAYTPADAPEVVEQIVDKLPKDARGSFAYDPTSTSWELRANVWTKTPVAEQAVGEAFEGYASFQGRDNGTAKFKGSGGIILLACLNAGTYTAEGENVSRTHRSRVLVDVESMLETALSSINVLAAAWGDNRAQEVEAPTGIPLEEAIPGFWQWLLTDRRSELAGVIPGRSAHHVERLTQAFWDERRDHEKLVRSDFAQGWTRYVQSQPSPIRRGAEAAIGDWLVNQRAVGIDLRDAL